MSLKIFSKIALNVFQEISYLLQTRLPYPWDFCRFNVDPTTRLLLNSRSYFAVYVAFILWFVKYALNTIAGFAGKKFKPKDYVFIIIISAATAVQILWPLLMLSTYFMTCSFYPWISALSVLSLYISDSPWKIFTVAITKSMEYLNNMDFNWSLDGIEDSVISRLDSSTYAYSGRGSTPELRTKEESLSFTPRPHSSVGTVSHKTIYGNLHRYKESVTQSAPENALSLQSSEKFTQDSSSENESKSFQSEKYVNPNEKKQVSFRRSIQIIDSRKEWPIVSTPSINAKSLSSGRLHDKFGYCGRCWRGNYLPFKQGFTFLRKPYTTRQGTIYGPPHRFLNLTDFLKKYGL